MQTYAQLQSFSKYNAIAIIGVIVEDFFERLRPHNMVTLAGQYQVHFPPYNEALPYKLWDGLFLRRRYLAQ
ncbi:hypothetical protein [Lysinibacillus sp. ZYM-1]|uniref:hypothetical protein n=1 Tax=Lysinibacillus sp. ZYM-1 TaxID=1681184 RepID=UPI000A9BEC56|nr:hypothetical protein [Lysinibacillus sp. ZYM-1]